MEGAIFTIAISCTKECQSSALTTKAELSHSFTGYSYVVWFQAFHQDTLRRQFPQQPGLERQAADRAEPADDKSLSNLLYS